MTTPKNPTNVRYLALPNSGIPNPFRPGSRKAACFELFRAGGERDAMIEAMKRTGVQGTTARTWLNLFRVYARGCREGKKGGAE